MANLKQPATRIAFFCVVLFLVLQSLPFPLCVLLLAAYLGRVDSSQSLEDDVARVSKRIRDRVQALGATLATSTAVHTMKEGEDDDAEVKAADAAGDAAVAPLRTCLWDLQKAQRLLEGPIHRQVARVVVYEEEIEMLSKERVLKLKAHAVEVQALQSEHHAQVKALNHEITTLRKDAAKERAAWEAAVQAAKEGGGENEDERVQAFNDEITMLRKNAAQERAASLLELQSRESELAAQWQAMRDEATHWQKEAEAARNEAAGMSMSVADLEAELNTAKAEVARYQAALEAAVQAAKEGGNDDELAEAQSRVEALTDEITMLRKNAARERAALEAAVQAAKEGGNDDEMVKQLKEEAADAQSRVQALHDEITMLRKEAAKEQEVWGLKAALQTANEAMYEELAKLKQQAVSDTRSLQDTHKSQVQALQNTIATVREEAVRERAAWEEAAAKAAGSESELAKWKEQAQAAEGLLETRQEELVTLRHQSAWQKATLEAAVKAAKEETAKLAAGTGYDESKQLVVKMQAKIDSLVQQSSDERKGMVVARNLREEEERIKTTTEAYAKWMKVSEQEKEQAKKKQEEDEKYKAALREEKRELMEEMQKMRAAFRRVQEEAVERGEECERWNSEMQGLWEERDAALAEVPRVMEKLRAKAEKEWEQEALLTAAGGMGGGGGEEGKEGGKEAQAKVPTTEDMAGTGATTTTKAWPLFPSFASLPPLAFSFGASPQASNKKTAAPGTAAAAAATTTTASSLLPPIGSSSLFSGSSLFGPSSPPSAFAPIAPPAAAAAAAPTPPAPHASSLFSNINPSFTSSWGNLSTTPATNEPATTTSAPLKMTTATNTTTTSLPIAPCPPIASKAPRSLSKPATKEEEAMPAPVPLQTTTATNKMTAPLPIGPYPPLASKAPRPIAMEKPATKEGEAMRVPLNKEIGTSTEPVAPSEEKEGGRAGRRSAQEGGERGSQGHSACAAAYAPGFYD